MTLRQLLDKRADLDAPLYFMADPRSGDYLEVATAMLVTPYVLSEDKDAGVVMTDDLGDPIPEGALLLFPN